MKQPRNIAITGASSGLGAALAMHYATSGITLYLHGRNTDRLRKVADSCRARGATVETYSVDVRDAEGMKSWLMAADDKTPLDLVIANAGISAGIGLPTPERSIAQPYQANKNSDFAQAGGGGENDAQSRAIFGTNIDGMNNTIQPIIPLMVGRRRGQIALIASLAGIRGLASSPAYSASKGWARLYGEGLRGWLKPYGVAVNVVCPGFIRTPLTDVNPYKMPLLMEPEKAARIIADGLAKNQARIAFPKLLYWPLWWLTCLPVSWTDPYFERLPGKPSL